jgi:hypothetical protein
MRIEFLVGTSRKTLPEGHCKTIGSEIRVEKHYKCAFSAGLELVVHTTICCVLLGVITLLSPF